jgi:hypothetical protein
VIKNKKIIFEILLAALAVCIIVPTTALAVPTVGFGPSDIVDGYSFNIGSIVLSNGTGSTSQIYGFPANVYLQPGPTYDLHATVYNSGLCNGTLDTNITNANFGSGIQICMYVEPIPSGSTGSPTHNSGPQPGDIILNEGTGGIGTQTLQTGTSITWITASDLNGAGVQWTNILDVIPSNPNGVMHSGDTYAVHYLFNILNNAGQGTTDTFKGGYQLDEYMPQP